MLSPPDCGQCSMERNVGMSQTHKGCLVPSFGLRQLEQQIHEGKTWE